MRIINLYTGIRIRVILLFPLFFTQPAAAQNGAARIVSQTVSPIYWQSIENSDMKNFLNPVVFPGNARVYEQPDTNSRVLQVLGFNTDLALIAEGSISGEIVSETTGADGVKHTQTRYTLFRWYEIIAGNEKGYIKATDVALHSLTGDDRSLFFVQCCDSPYYTPKVYKYSPAKKMFTDTLNVPLGGGYSVWRIDHTGWKNTNLLFRITSLQPYCGGGRTDLFVIDANDTTTILTTSGYNNSEDLLEDPREESVVYLPVRFLNGKILAVESGDIANGFDPFTGSLKIYPFPAGQAIPRQQLIIRKVKVTTEKVLQDKRGRPLANKAGNTRTTEKTVITYYRWNGHALVRVKNP